MYRRKDFKGIKYNDKSAFSENILFKILDERKEPTNVSANCHSIYMPEKEVVKIFETKKILISDYFINPPKKNDFISFHIMENPTDDTGFLEWYHDTEPGREFLALYRGNFKGHRVSEYGMITDVKDEYAYFDIYEMIDVQPFGVAYTKVDSSI